jgi:hypothetical protein
MAGILQALARIALIKIEVLVLQTAPDVLYIIDGVEASAAEANNINPS